MPTATIPTIIPPTTPITNIGLEEATRLLDAAHDHLRDTAQRAAWTKIRIRIPDAHRAVVTVRRGRAHLTEVLTPEGLARHAELGTLRAEMHPELSALARTHDDGTVRLPVRSEETFNTEVRR